MSLGILKLLGLIAVLGAGTTLAQECTGILSLPRYYQEQMIIQADGNPKIWGYTTNADCPVYVEASCQDENGNERFVSAHTSSFEKQGDTNIWEVIMDPLGSSGDKCTLTISLWDDPQGAITLTTILGDVWVCSGQSNMELKMNQIENADEEILNSAKYSNIRIYQLAHHTSEQEENDIFQGWDEWYTPDESSKLSSFSAVCFLTARYLTDLMGDNKRVFGLIEASWGGTRVEAWSSQDALDSCNVEPSILPDQPYNSNSYLWNGMIHPLLRTTVKGFLWYQGESNAGHNRDIYQCTFPAMISDWRQKFSTITDETPFGFVQLSTNIGADGVEIRWHQTGDIGFVPNEILDNVFMATAIDTYDEENNIHPRYKQIIGERLSYAAANVAYGMAQYPTNGPFVETVLQVDGPYEVTFNEAFIYSNEEISGFYTCCQPVEDCDAPKGSWIQVPKEAVLVVLEERKLILDLSAQCTTSLAYMWEDIPVKAYLGAPIYGDDEYHLPAAPWKISL